jgi:hypothetical protein
MLGSVNGFSAGLADVPILNILTTTAKLQPDEMDKVVDNHKMSQCGANGYRLYLETRQSSSLSADANWEMMAQIPVVLFPL